MRLTPPHRRLRVALLVQTASHWSREVLFGVGSYAREHGGWEFFSQPRGFHESLELPSDLEIDGVVCRLTSSSLYESLVKRSIPCVNVSWLGWEHTDITRVCSDEVGCARLAAEFYRGKDYRSIGFIGPPSSLAYSSRLRAKQPLQHTALPRRRRRKLPVGCSCTGYLRRRHSQPPEPECSQVFW